MLKMRDEEPVDVMVPEPKLFDAVPQVCCSHTKSYVILGKKPQMVTSLRKCAKLFFFFYRRTRWIRIGIGGLVSDAGSKKTRTYFQVGFKNRISSPENSFIQNVRSGSHYFDGRCHHRTRSDEFIKIRRKIRTR